MKKYLNQPPEKPKRPRVKSRRSGLEIALEVVAFFALAIIWGLTIHHFPHLPESVPTHFNAIGQPDAWGNRSAVLHLPIIALGMYTMLTIARRFPHYFNYPWPITERNAAVQYALAQQLITSLKTCVVCIFGYMAWIGLANALGTRQGLGAWFLPASMSLVFGILIIFFVRANRAKQPV